MIFEELSLAHRSTSYLWLKQAIVGCKMAMCDFSEAKVLMEECLSNKDSGSENVVNTILELILGNNWNQVSMDNVANPSFYTLCIEKSRLFDQLAGKYGHVE
jgi:hypothetical protein